VAYSTVAAVKQILHIGVVDETHDTEIGECIVSADALVDGLLKKVNLSVPESVPQTVADASAHFAAWLFKDRRGPEATDVFWDQAHKFLDFYIESEEEIAFVVGTGDS
jgi:hypothetical protein